MTAQKQYRGTEKNRWGTIYSAQGDVSMTHLDIPEVCFTNPVSIFQSNEVAKSGLTVIPNLNSCTGQSSHHHLHPTDFRLCQIPPHSLCLHRFYFIEYTWNYFCRISELGKNVIFFYHSLITIPWKQTKIEWLNILFWKIQASYIRQT